MTYVKVSAPATIANLGPGFDVLGLALEGPRDVVEMIVEDGDEVTIERVDGVDSNVVSRDPDKNTAAVAVRHLMSMVGLRKRVEIRILKGVPVGAGLGSSGASAAAAVYGLVRALDLNVSPELMVIAAAKGEEAAAGSAHADNVAPSILGGLCAVVSRNPIRVVRVDVPEDIQIVIVRPMLKTSANGKTRAARSILPRQVSLEQLVEQCGSLAAVLLGLALRNYVLLGYGVSGDHVIEPVRSVMIPGFYKVKRAALEAGAFGCAISGAGPSVFAVVDPERARDVERAMREAFEDEGVQAESYITRPSNVGARVELIER